YISIHIVRVGFQKFFEAQIKMFRYPLELSFGCEHGTPGKGATMAAFMALKIQSLVPGFSF
ncbi:uncharacterized protein METZ01_LOCUS381477, partial [marine metagenome]